MSYGGPIRIGALASGLAAAALLSAGCGGGKGFADKPRPPAPLMLSGVITSSGVTVSPNHAGAGPLVIEVSIVSELPMLLLSSTGKPLARSACA